MAVFVEMHHTGDTVLQRDVVAMVEHVLSDRPGDWRVTIIGTEASDRWEMKIFGRTRSNDRTRSRVRPENMSRG